MHPVEAFLHSAHKEFLPRLGRLRLSMPLVEDACAIRPAKIFGAFIPLYVEHDAERNTLVITAHSPLFDYCSDVENIPDYTVTVTTDGCGNFIFGASKRGD